MPENQSGRGGQDRRPQGSGAGRSGGSGGGRPGGRSGGGRPGSDRGGWSGRGMLAPGTTYTTRATEVALVEEVCPAASYSPTQSPVQYHRR